MIFYWYDPQYLNAVYDLSDVKLPTRFKGCIDDEKPKRKARMRVRRRVPDHRQAGLEQVREERLAGGQGDQELEVDVGRPEHGREHDLGEAHGQGQGRGVVGEGEHGQGRGLAEVTELLGGGVRAPAG